MRTKRAICDRCDGTGYVEGCAKCDVPFVYYDFGHDDYELLCPNCGLEDSAPGSPNYEVICPKCDGKKYTEEDVTDEKPSENAIGCNSIIGLVLLIIGLIFLLNAARWD
jgi:hypothetical protein